jgi:hypothetical protein
VCLEDGKPPHYQGEKSTLTIRTPPVDCVKHSGGPASTPTKCYLAQSATMPAGIMHISKFCTHQDHIEPLPLWSLDCSCVSDQPQHRAQGYLTATCQLSLTRRPWHRSSSSSVHPQIGSAYTTSIDAASTFYSIDVFAGAWRDFDLALTPSLLPRADHFLQGSHISRMHVITNLSRATGEPLAVAATPTVQTSLKTVEVELLPAAATPHLPPLTARHLLALPPCHQLPLRLHSQQAWPKTSLPTSQTNRAPSAGHPCSSVRKMRVSSHVATS